MIINNIKMLTVTHVNCYNATINNTDFISFFEDDSIIKITLKNDYHYEDFGCPRWESIKPFDKDEITSIYLEFQNGESKNISIPFKDISSNGALCINEQSESYEDEYSITIEWKKFITK